MDTQKIANEIVRLLTFTESAQRSVIASKVFAENQITDVRVTTEINRLVTMGLRDKRRARQWRKAEREGLSREEVMEGSPPPPSASEHDLTGPNRRY